MTAGCAAGAVVLARVVVAGRSMVPTLLPGDRLLVVRLPGWWPLRGGSLVAVRDPRRSERLLIKRLSVSGPRTVVVLGDNLAESTDSRELGPLPRRSVVGVAWYRYAPPERAGRLHRT